MQLQNPCTMGGINRQHHDNGTPVNIREITSYYMHETKSTVNIPL